MFRPSDLQTFKRSHDVQTYPLCIQIVAHSFALFCTHKNINSFIFKRFRTLWPKHGGVGYPLTSRNKGILSELNKDRAAKHRVAPSKSQLAEPPCVSASAAATGRVSFLFPISPHVQWQQARCTCPPCLVQTISIESSNTTTSSVPTIAPSGEIICITAIGFVGMNPRKRPSFSSSSTSLSSQR